MKELEEASDPLMLGNILKDGIMRYARYPLTVPAVYPGLKPRLLITHALENLTQAGKMKVAYRLFGRKLKRGLKVPGGLMQIMKA